MFHPNGFIKENIKREFGKLKKSPKVFYLSEVSRENLIGTRILLQNRTIRELIDEIPTGISIQTKRAAMEVLTKSINDIRMGKTLEIEPIKRTVKQIVEDILANHRKAMVKLVEIRSFDEYTFSHSINVSILSAIIGIGLDMGREELERLVLGAMLHDIGKIKVDPSILAKPGRLNPREFKEVMMHTQYGWEILLQDLKEDLVARESARHHHERRDGRGYPDGLRGDEISDFAGIVGVADVYDAMTTDRPYRKGIPPYEAMRTIITLSESGFKKMIVEAFLSMVSIYPQGSTVRLNTGEIAIVVRANRKAILRPVLRLLVDADGHRFVEKVEVDLLNQPHRFIVGYVRKEALLGV